MTDDAIENHLLAAGYTPGEPVTANVLRAFTAFVAADVLAALLDVRRRYVIRPGERYDQLTRVTSLTATENCLRAACAALGEPYASVVG